MKQGDKNSLPKGWEIKKLGEVAKVMYGYTEKSYIEEIGPKFLRITDIQNDGVNWDTVPYCYINDSDFEKYKLINGDIVFARTGATTGKSYLVINPPKSVFASYLIKLNIINIDLLPEFLFLYFQTKAYWDTINAGISGSAQGGFNATKLSELQIPFPPKEEQQRIVAKLDEAFEAIEKTKANAEQNLKNTKELFDSYLHSIFENKGKDWEIKKINEICTLINGRAYNKQELLSEGKYRVLRVGNFFTNNNWFYSNLELSEEKYCDEGDLLYAWSASFGPRVWEGEKVIYHYHIWKVIPNLNLISKEFLYILLEWDKESIKKAQGTGTTMMHVSKGSMEARLIPLPPIAEQQSIVQKLDALSSETKKLEAIYRKKLEDLEELKKSILQKAFCGQL